MVDISYQSDPLPIHELTRSLGIGQIIAEGLDGTCQSVIEGSSSRPGSKRDDSCGLFQVAVVTLVTVVAGR